jgi:hypothetical protein
MGIEPETAERRNQATTHANASIRPSEQRVDRRLDLFARPRHCPQMRLSFGDSLETTSTTIPEARPDLSGTVTARLELIL